ncbi:MAG: DUF4249 domain-containing protein [Candidatus Marinimicrobia bacterium]|nr:DUF4249 domain-containing protein [Candidatus Neomarinimicrobiota bacterium]
MKNIIYPTLLFSLLIASCDMETVIDLDIPPHEPVLVLNGLLDTDTNTRVVISHSVGAFSNAVPSFINNANVLLYKENQFIDSLLLDTTNLVYVNYYDDYAADSLAMYYYKSDYFPAKNTNYRIEVGHSDYPSISAETFIPDDITVYNIDVDTTSNEQKIGLTFSFEDNANQQNYYRLKVFSSCVKEWEDEYGDDQQWGYRGDAYMMSNDPSFPGDIPWEGYTFSGHRVVFSDALFNGQQKTITLDVQSELKYGECDTVIIEFSTFSDDTYSYYNSLGDHSEKGELNIFGGEVIPVYTNVENGLGVLISTNAQQIYLKP